MSTRKSTYAKCVCSGEGKQDLVDRAGVGADIVTLEQYRAYANAKEISLARGQGGGKAFRRDPLVL